MTYPEDAPVTSSGRMMMRVIDFEGYCASIQAPSEAKESITIELEDRHCDWNSRTYRIIPTNGKLEVDHVTTAPDIVVNDLQLSRIISGRTPASMLRGIGEIECSKETAVGLESIFPMESFVSYQRF